MRPGRRALANLGMVAERQSAYARARALLKEALTLFRGLVARDDIAGTLTALGLVSEFQGDYDTAWSLLEEGLALFRTLGDAWGSANTLGNMASRSAVTGVIVEFLLPDAQRERRAYPSKEGNAPRVRVIPVSDPGLKHLGSRA